jgi:cytochrome P450
MFNYTIITAFFITFLIIFLYVKRQRLPLPPGPPPIPIIGNLHQIPKQNPWRTYQEWHKKYGPIITLRMGSNITIILGSDKVARDLLEKRSSNYSSRPHMLYIGDYIFGGFLTSLLPYGSRWRLHHRIQMTFINIRTSQEYRTLQNLESKQLLQDLIRSNDFSSAFRRYSASILFALIYGKRIISGNESEMHELGEIGEIIDKVNQEAGEISVIESFPILKSLPGFLIPGKRSAQHCFDQQSRILGKNMEAALRTSSWNWCKQAQKLEIANAMGSVELSFVIGSLYEASHTVPMIMEVFVMASILCPEAVILAQAELDKVVGINRLPSFEDKPRLPILMAFIQEVMRWRPISPAGMPHASLKDDEYMGYHIPQGATVVANHWSIDLDKDVFDDPHDFRPQRWIKNPNLRLSTFGFGRRICPGRHIGENSVYSMISCILWGFDIDSAYENGKRTEIDSWNMTQGADSRPMPFKASFQSRSKEHQKIMERDCRVSTEDFEGILNSIGSKFK